MKKGFGLLILLFLCNILQGQNYDDIIKDLHQQLDAHPTKDEKRVDLLNELSYAYRRSTPQKIDSFAREALKLGEQLGYPKGMGIAYKNIGIATFKLGGNTDDVMVYYQKCYDMAEQGNDYYNQAACSNNIGLSHRSKLQYAKAIKSFQKAYDIHEKHLELDRLRLLIIGNIGQAYMSMDDHKNAEKYLGQALTLADRHNNEAITAMYIGDYVFTQYQQGNSKEAIETIINHLPKIKSVGDHETFVQTTAMLSEILIKEQQFDRALTHVEEALQIAETYNFPVEKCEITINQSRILFEKGNHNKALYFGEIAYDCAAERLDYQLQMKAAKNLLSIYLATQNTAKANDLLPTYNNLMERHFDIQKQKTYASLEAHYQNEKKEIENIRLKTQKSENQSTIKFQRILGLFVFLLSLLVIGGILYAYHTKRTQNELLEQKVEERTKALNESYHKLERSNQDLERSNEELERFAYIASHDLKQPLNTVISFSGLLDKEVKGKLDKKGETYLNYVIKGGNQMKRIIEDILEYSKLSEQEREPQLIDLNVLVDEVKDSISELIERKNAQVNIVGELSSLVHEKTKMLLLFKNFIENGIKYNQSETPTIDIQQVKYGHFTRISFKDNGIGIEEKYFPKLFKMFSRLQNEKDYEGTGLGLSLCKKIVSNMGGNVSVESQLGTGSTFHVDIPGDFFLKKEEIKQFAQI